MATQPAPVRRHDAARTGADALVDTLERLDVEVVFGLPGVHNLAVWRALDDSAVRLIGVRHEQTTVYAGDGLARATGRLGVAITTSGPGAANAVAATGEAWTSGSPVLVIATDISSALRSPGVYRGALHETRDQGAFFAPVVKRVLRATTADEIPRLVADAAAAALAAPTGPVYLEIPTDLLDAPVPAAISAGVAAPTDPAEAVEGLAAAAKLIDAAERPLIWAGGGALRAGAGSEVGRLALKLGAPVIETFTARGLLPLSHPCRVGPAPHFPESGRLWDEADLVVAIGTDFDGMMTQNWAMPRPRHLVAINVDREDAVKNYPPDSLLVGDALAVTSALADAVAERNDTSALVERLTSARANVRRRLRDEEPEAMTFLDTLADSLPERAMIVADMCVAGYWVAALHDVERPRGLAYPVGWGTLGFAFPASLGAAVASSDPVLCICGDGGFMYACGELATARQESIPVTILIVDDGGYGMLRYEQDLLGDPRSGVDLLTPDFASLVGAFDIPVSTVEGVGEELAHALRTAFADDGPSVVVSRAQFRPPPSTSPRWYRRSRSRPAPRMVST